MSMVINNFSMAAVFNQLTKLRQQHAGKAKIAFALALMTLWPQLAMAAPWDDGADKVLEILTGGFARTCAVIAVAALGWRCWAGQMSWAVGLTVIAGVVLVFGAASAVDYFA